MKHNANLLDKVKNALSEDPRLREDVDNIYILVNDGAVILAGSVKNTTSKEQAIKTVSGIPGVNLLIEDLTVEPQRNSGGILIDFGKKNNWHYPVTR
jgi:osmotically-inducible protein OsmY